MILNGYHTLLIFLPHMSVWTHKGPDLNPAYCPYYPRQMLPVPVQLPAAESPPSSGHLDGRGKSSSDSGSLTPPPPILRKTRTEKVEG